MTIISFNFPPLSSDWAHCNLIGRPTNEQFMGRLYVENEKEKEAEFEAGKKSKARADGAGLLLKWVQKRRGDGTV